MAELWVQGIGRWCSVGGKLGRRKLYGGAAQSPLLWRCVGAREGWERVRVSARESARPRCLQRYPDHGMGLAPAYDSHASFCGSMVENLPNIIINSSGLHETDHVFFDQLDKRNANGAIHSLI